MITNANRNMVERTYYAPYGAVLNRSMRDGPGYTGHEEDPATGLVYMQQRYYDPQSGRFISTDPMPVTADGGNFNRYGYANDNPYRYTDPFGACADHYANGTCEVFLAPGVAPNKQAEMEQDRIQGFLNEYDHQVHTLKDSTIYRISTINGKDKLFGSKLLARAEVSVAENKKIWDTQHITIVANGTYEGVNGGEGATYPGHTFIEAKAVTDWSRAAGSNAVGVSSLIFHEFAHVTNFMQRDVPAVYGPNSIHPAGTPFERIDETTGGVMAHAVGAPFSCATMQGGCW